MESHELEIGRRYAYREKRGPHYPMLKVRLLDKVGRKGKIKIRFEDGPHPGLEEYVCTRQLVVPWGQRHEVLRDEKLAAALDEHAAQSRGSGARRSGKRGAGVDRRAGRGRRGRRHDDVRVRAAADHRPSRIDVRAGRPASARVPRPPRRRAPPAGGNRRSWRARSPPRNHRRSSATWMIKRRRCGFAATSPANAGGTATCARKRPASRSHVSGRARAGGRDASQGNRASAIARFTRRVRPRARGRSEQGAASASRPRRPVDGEKTIGAYAARSQNRIVACPEGLGHAGLPP